MFALPQRSEGKRADASTCLFPKPQRLRWEDQGLGGSLDYMVSLKSV